MKTIRMLSILILTVMFCAFIPNFALAAGGAGPEPGAACGEGLKYLAPPYIGDVTATWNDDLSVDLAGAFLPQKGNSNCVASITLTDAYGEVSLEDFQNLKPNDLRQTCLDKDTHIVIMNCEGVNEFFEVVGVGGLMFNEDGTAFTAQFVVMELQ